MTDREKPPFAPEGSEALDQLAAQATDVAATGRAAILLATERRAFYHTLTERDPAVLASYTEHLEQTRTFLDAVTAAMCNSELPDFGPAQVPEVIASAGLDIDVRSAKFLQCIAPRMMAGKQLRVWRQAEGRQHKAYLTLNEVGLYCHSSTRVVKVWAMMIPPDDKEPFMVPVSSDDGPGRVHFANRALEALVTPQRLLYIRDATP